MRRALRCRPAAGTSLVEALVAMSIMAFGMLAVVGTQATLRLNADVAKQRSEAVRIAQEAMETARSFSIIATTAGRLAYADITDVSNQAVVSDVSDRFNTAFLLSRTVVAHTAPDRKEISVHVDWTDRSGTPQRVELHSVIGANDPAASLALGARPNGIPERQPLGRHPAIPPQAVSVGEGLSGFKPPGPSGDSNVVWVFNDLTGIIVGVCNTVVTGQAALTSADISSCSNNANGLPLSGFVRFATDNPPNGATRHSAAVAENPPNTAFNLGVVLTSLSSAGNANPTYVCYTDAPTTYLTTQTTVAYRCAILFDVGAPLVWSAIAELTPQPFLFDLPTGYASWALAVDATDARDSRFRVCRYTPATSDAQMVPNRQHPRQYVNAIALEPLVDQNFLVIRAGNGTVAFTCPTDVTPDPTAGDFVNSNTLVHQPAP